MRKALQALSVIGALAAIPEMADAADLCKDLSKAAISETTKPTHAASMQIVCNPQNQDSSWLPSFTREKPQHQKMFNYFDSIATEHDGDFLIKRLLKDKSHIKSFQQSLAELKTHYPEDTEYAFAALSSLIHILDQDIVIVNRQTFLEALKDLSIVLRDMHAMDPKFTQDSGKFSQSLYASGIIPSISDRLNASVVSNDKFMKLNWNSMDIATLEQFLRYFYDSQATAIFVYIMAKENNASPSTLNKLEKSIKALLATGNHISYEEIKKLEDIARK